MVPVGGRVCPGKENPDTVVRGLPGKSFLYGVFLFVFSALADMEPAAAAVNPHYGEIVCTACHVDEEKYELHSEDSAELCNRCHGEGMIAGHHHPLRAVPQEIAVPKDWPLLKGRLTCLTCHLPSHPESIGQFMFLRGEKGSELQDFCFLCHSRSKVTSRNPHEESNGGTGCGFCHDSEPIPGVDTIYTVTFCSDPTVLCLRCHDDVPHPADFDHSRRLEEDIARQIGSGLHLYEKNTIICSTCHNPHEFESQNHKLRGVIQGVEACPGCHDN